MKTINKSKGFTLVELLVGLVVSTAVLGTVAGVFVPSMTTYRSNQAVASLQENQRFLIGAVSSAVDQAGFIGCDSREPVNVVNATNLPGAAAATATWLRDFGAPVRITPAGTSAEAYIGSDINILRPSATGGGAAYPAGDVLTLLSAGLSTFVLTEHLPAAETVTFRGDLTAELSERVITINDCRNTAVFELGIGVVNAATATTPTTTTFSYSAANTDNCNGGGTTRVLLGSQGGVPSCTDAASQALFDEYTFREGTNSAEMVAQSFLIATPGDGITSLFAVRANPDNTFTSTRLVAGVDNMRVRFGIRTTSGVIEYRTAPNFIPPQNIDGAGLPETFSDVVAIEATFLLNSGLTRGVRGNTEVQEFDFPPVDGTADVTCDGTNTGNNENSACPIYLSSTGVSRGQLRRVVKKIFNLRNITL